MKFFLILFLIAVTIISCKTENDHTESVGITNFKLDSTALHENDLVKLLFASSRDDANPRQDHLVQFVGVRKGSKDTVNILCFRSDFIQPNDGDKFFRYKLLDPQNRERVALTISNMKLFFNKDTTAAPSNAMEQLIMVSYDPKFKSIEENTYPTVIGELVAE